MAAIRTCPGPSGSTSMAPTNAESDRVADALPGAEFLPMLPEGETFRVLFAKQANG